MTKLEKVTKGLECCKTGPTFQSDCEDKKCPYRTDPNRCIETLCTDALELLKDSGQDEGWLCEKRTSGRQLTDLLCACGNKVYFTALLFRDGFTANELFCPNCGLSMRSPYNDKGGAWLRKHWEEVVLKKQEPILHGEKIKAGDVMLDFYECGYCKNAIRKPWKYCPFCGKEVTWDD